MVTLIIGKKGSGKTKKLIQMANDAVNASSGNVVVIDKGSKLTYDVTHRARLIDINQYEVKGYDSLYGFIGGICAGNYDVTDIFVDAVFKICGEDFDLLSILVDKLQSLAKITDTKITLLISASESELPESLLNFCAKP